MEDCLVECRALGLVGKYLTGPWMRLVEQDIGILELNKHYNEAVDALAKFSKDAIQVVNGRAPPVFKDVPMVKDEIFKVLTENSDLDTQTSALLTRLFGSILEDCLRQLKEQLPGGKYDEPTEEVRRQAQSCTGNNISGERVFGQLDYQLKRAPNANVTYSESKLMYSNNATEKWLDEKADGPTKEALLSRARQQARTAQECDRRRQHDIEQQRQQHLKEKRIEMEKKEQDSRESREALIDELAQHGGLWKTEEQMNINLRDKTSAQKLFAMKVQLNVRKKILQQKAASDLFAFSANRKPHTVEILKSNLLKLIQNAERHTVDSTVEHTLSNPSSLVGREISHLWTDEKGESWWNGKIKRRVENSDEFLIEYQQIACHGQSAHTTSAYLELSEIVADIRSGELKLL